MTTWTTILQRAAGPDHHDATQAMTTAIEAALAGTLTADVAAALFADANLSRSHVSNAVAARIGALEGAELAAARAVIRALPDLQVELVAVAVHVPVRPDVVRAGLESLEAAERHANAAGPGGSGSKCPVCGSTRVLEQSTTALHGKLTELMCDLCGTLWESRTR